MQLDKMVEFTLIWNVMDVVPFCLGYLSWISVLSFAWRKITLGLNSLTWAKSAGIPEIVAQVFYNRNWEV